MFSFIWKFDIFMKFIQNIDVHDVFDAVALDVFAPISWKKGTLRTSLIGVLIWYVPIVIFCRNNYTV